MDSASVYLYGPDRLGSPILKADTAVSLAMAVPIFKSERLRMSLSQQGDRLLNPSIGGSSLRSFAIREKAENP
jgi:hypothetical protein